LTLIENTHRTDNLAAKLEAIDTLRKNATPEEICTAVGISQPELTKAIKLLNELAPELRTAMKEGRIKTTAAQKAAKLPFEQQQVLAKQDIIKSKDVVILQKQQPTEEQPANLLQSVEVNYGDRIRGKTLKGEMLEGIADRVGHKYVRLSTGEDLSMETVELLEAASENVGEPFAEAPSGQTNDKVSKQSWKLQAKPLIEQLLEIVPAGEDVREYLELVADTLKKKA
jgi:hypothetical protein